VSAPYPYHQSIGNAYQSSKTLQHTAQQYTALQCTLHAIALDTGTRYVLLFLQNLCKDAQDVTSKFTYGITTCDEGPAATVTDADGLKSPEMLELLKSIKSLSSPVESLLKLALENAVPCAAGFHQLFCSAL
jgi:hypothetical protein